MRLRAATAALAAVLAFAASAQDARPGALRFAGADEARAALVADDDWMATTSPFQRAATLGSADAVDVSAFKAALARAGHACSEQEQQRWNAAAAIALPRIREIGLPVPWPVTIVCTDGSDAAGAPYTRGRAIFMPRDGEAGPRDAFVLVHEIVHVTSRANPPLATRLYRELGFEPVADLAWPREWLDARISNPDAPHSRHAMQLDTPAGRQWVVPLLVAGRTQLRPGESFFHVLQVRVLAITPGTNGQPSQPVRRDGHLLWWPVEALPAYLQRLGGNTGYVLHPEETLADNIALLALQRPARNPALLDRLRAALAGSGATPSKKETRP
jgi:hypothetical protein